MAIARQNHFAYHQFQRNSPSSKALKAESEDDGPAAVVHLNRIPPFILPPFFNEHLTCFHILECPFQGNGIFYNAINMVKA